MNQELIAAYREARSRPLSSATSALREARGSLTHAPLELDFYTDMPEVFEYVGKWVRVETGYDDTGLLWDDDLLGELHGFDDGYGRYDRDDLERWRPARMATTCSAVVRMFTLGTPASVATLRLSRLRNSQGSTAGRA